MPIITPREVRADINRAIHCARDALMQLEKQAEVEDDAFFLLFLDEYADLAIAAGDRMAGYARKAKELRARLAAVREWAA